MQESIQINANIMQSAVDALNHVGDILTVMQARPLATPWYQNARKRVDKASGTPGRNSTGSDQGTAMEKGSGDKDSASNSQSLLSKMTPGMPQSVGHPGPATGHPQVSTKGTGGGGKRSGDILPPQLATNSRLGPTPEEPNIPSSQPPSLVMETAETGQSDEVLAHHGDTGSELSHPICPTTKKQPTSNNPGTGDLEVGSGARGTQGECQRPWR
ncbi:UNVERIFIED_CONTAM: hypothetical protein K2H54_037153 [Gekko kuhli]